MIFESLYESAKRGELLLVEHGFCRFRLRRDGQLTIHEIIVTRPGEGIGGQMLTTLTQLPGVKCILAKCPTDLPSNGWYKRRGFQLQTTETLPSGRSINVWVLALV